MENNMITRMHTYIIASVTIGLIASCIAFDIPLYYGLFSSVIFSMILLNKIGFSFKNLLYMIVKSIRECTSIFIIILLIGAIISIWIASGTVPAVIYYGFNYIQNINYLVACFLISMVISIVMGSPLGTISTIGIALMGIGRGLDIPAPILLGAIISGAFVADKISPIAALVNLTVKVINLRYREYIKHMLVTLIPMVLLTLTAYYILGIKYSSKIDIARIGEYQRDIASVFYISPFLLLFPVMIIIFAVMGVKIIPNMSIGLFGGIGVSLFFQKLSFSEVIKVIFLGYRANTGIEELNNILKGGGIIPMMEVILVVMGAIALSSLFEGTNMINPIIDQVTSKVKTRGNLVLKTSLLSAGLNAITCDQTVGILLLGKLLQRKYQELGINRLTLARTISDTGTTIAPLFPWNSNSIIIGAITGISALEYGPFTVLCYISPLITILIGYINLFKEKEVTGKWKKEIGDTR